MRVVRRPVAEEAHPPWPETDGARRIKNIAYGIACFAGSVLMGGVLVNTLIPLYHDKRSLNRIIKYLRSLNLQSDLSKESWEKLSMDDINSIARARCYWEELVRQNHYLDLPELRGKTGAVLHTEKTYQRGFIFLALSLFEQGFVHGILLTQIPKYILRRIAPGKEAVLDSSIAKIIRISLMVGLHAALTSPSNPELILKVAGGILKESKVGLPGSIGLLLGANLAVDRLAIPC